MSSRASEQKPKLFGKTNLCQGLVQIGIRSTGHSMKERYKYMYPSSQTVNSHCILDMILSSRTLEMLLTNRLGFELNSQIVEVFNWIILLSFPRNIFWKNPRLNFHLTRAGAMKAKVRLEILILAC